MFLQFLFTKKPIALQIENYCAWKALRFPTAAYSHGKELNMLASFSKVRNVTEMELDTVYGFISQYDSSYMRSSAVNTFRQFFKYCKMMGYVNIELAPLPPTAMIPSMEKIHPLLHVDKVKRVQALRDQEGLSFRQIKVRMESEDKRKYDLKNLHNWYKKDISLSTA